MSVKKEQITKREHEVVEVVGLASECVPHIAAERDRERPRKRPRTKQGNVEEIIDLTGDD